MSAPQRPSRRSVRTLLLGLLSLGSMGVGYLLHGLREPDVAYQQSYEIRGSSGGLTNPLLDYEVSGYRRGRELRPFKREIEGLVDRMIAAHTAERISIYFRDLDNGPSFGIRAQEGFIGASLLKVPTVMAALLQAEDNPGFLTRTVRFEGYPGEDSPSQYVPEQRMARGLVYTVDELHLRAAAFSDNAAVGVLNRITSPQYITRVFRELDVPHPPPEQPGARSITPNG